MLEQAGHWEVFRGWLQNTQQELCSTMQRFVVQHYLDNTRLHRCPSSTLMSQPSLREKGGIAIEVKQEELDVEVQYFPRLNACMQISV